MNSLRLPTITNADLTMVRAQGLEADYDRAAEPGAIKWEGTERVNAVHVTEEQTRASRGDLGLPMSDIFVERTVVVHHPFAIEFEEGDVVYFTRDGKDPESGTVQWLRTTDGLGLGGVTRLILDRA